MISDIEANCSDFCHFAAIFANFSGLQSLKVLSYFTAVSVGTYLYSILQRKLVATVVSNLRQRKISSLLHIIIIYMPCVRVFCVPSVRPYLLCPSIFCIYSTRVFVFSVCLMS